MTIKRMKDRESIRFEAGLGLTPGAIREQRFTISIQRSAVTIAVPLDFVARKLPNVSYVQVDFKSAPPDSLPKNMVKG